jgi:hypothetical protein
LPIKHHFKYDALMRKKSAISTVAASAAVAYAAPALDKGLDILEVLADAPQGLALHGIARATNCRTASNRSSRWWLQPPP